MGNSLGGRKSAKVMKITGETFKLKTPVRAGSVLASHPGLVLLESEAVKHFGARAKPLEPQMELKPKRLYFLVELPKFPEDKSARRVRSGIQMSAKDRLESMMLARRSSSDLTLMRPRSIAEEGGKVESNGDAGVRVRMRLPKAEVERLMAESKDGAEAAERIVGLCISSGAAGNGGGAKAERNVQWSGDLGRGGMARGGPKSRERRVGFMPITSTEEIQLAVS